jgi:pimeloyl-ACP methyl ester carboxylesterase
MRLWSHPAAHATIAAAVERLRDLHRLPAVPIFTFGESGGGMFSQALAEAYPGLVDGIASTGGAAFELKGDARCPILALNTAGDYTTAANDELTDFYRARGVPVLRQLTNMEWHRRGKPSWLPFHCTNEDARQLSLRFHLALSELRHGHGGRLPSADAWPFAVRADDPRRLAATQSVGWRTALGDGPVTMLPSRSFAAAWLRVPQAPHRVPGSGPLCWRADPSPLTKPKGVVVRRWRGQQGLTTPQGLRGDDQSCALDLRYLAEQGYVAVAVNDNWSGTPAVLARLGETSLPTYAFAPQAQVDEITQIVDIAAFTQATVALPCDDDGAAALAPAQAALRRGLPLTLVVATADGTGAGSPLAVLGDALAPIPRQQQQRQRDIEDVHQQALGIAVVRFDARR